MLTTRTRADPRSVGAPQSASVAEDGVPPFGALSSLAKDNIYWFGRRGLIFTSPWVVTPMTVRHTAVLLLSSSTESFQLSVGGRVLRGEAFAIAPLTPRGLQAIDVGLVSVNIEAGHSRFRAFGTLSSPGVLALDRSAFRALDASLQGAYDGRLSYGQAERLFESLVETAAEQLPGARRRDERAERIHALLRENPTCSLGELAGELNVSYSSASRVFAQAVGLPLRSYQHWMKTMQATERLHADIALTRIAHDCGFADSAHLSHTWQRNYGLSPSYIRDPQHVRLVLEPEAPVAQQGGLPHL